jgi:hypothetical protein
MLARARVFAVEVAVGTDPDEAHAYEWPIKT